MMEHVFNPSTPEAAAGGSLSVWGQQGLHSKLQDSQSYSETSSKNNILSRTEKLNDSKRK